MHRYCHIVWTIVEIITKKLLTIEIVNHNYTTATSMKFVDKEADCTLKFNTGLKNENTNSL